MGNLSMDSASRIARNHETVARSLTQLQTASIRNSCEVPINATRPAYLNAGVHRFCSRCGEKHFTPAKCQHRFTICNFSRQRVTLRRCALPRKNPIRHQPESTQWKKTHCKVLKLSTKSNKPATWPTLHMKLRSRLTDIL